MTILEGNGLKNVFKDPSTMISNFTLQKKSYLKKNVIKKMFENNLINLRMYNILKVLCSF